MSLKATEVFVPGSYPEHTYVEREGESIEHTLLDALNTPGQVVSLSGPSKSGKTVLVEKVVGKDLLIPLSGASLRSADQVWERILDWMGAPTGESESVAKGEQYGAEVGAKGGCSIPFFGKTEVSAAGKGEKSSETTSVQLFNRSGLSQVVREIGGSDFVVLIDDFHYLPRDVQPEVAKSLKEAVRLGVKIVTAAVSHRGDDIVRANPELRGRVRAIDLKYWQPSELAKIAEFGFSALNVELDHPTVDRLVGESAGSPQLMQSLCLQACFVLNRRERAETALLPRQLDVSPDTLERIFEQTSASTDYRSLVDVLDAGPKTRGAERKTYRFADGIEGDVYRVVLRAIAADPPRLSFAYDELLQRTVKPAARVGGTIRERNLA
ncbi:MAG: hypothetical protein KJZ84_02050, partial [Bryobacteraceae bacterium]|nr:hypothetical protein [Bryobacteraceae bacterium]